MLNAEQFERTLRLASRLAGIELSARHRELLDHRFRRVGLRDAASVDALLAAAEAGEAAATRQVLNVLTTRYTAFFRHPHHFARAAAHALRACERQGRVGLWCAAVATGEEAYSLAMAILESLPERIAPAAIRIFASDIDAEALSAAALGKYREAAMQAVDARRRERFFRLDAGGVWSPVEAVRNLIEFQQVNLTDPYWEVDGPFEVVFCRNVLMYLEGERRAGVLRGLAARMAPGGLLLLDPTEYIGAAGGLFSPLGDGMYTPAALRFPGAAEVGPARTLAGSGTH